MHLAVPFKQPSRYTYNTCDTHAAVAHPHTHFDPYKWYCMNGTARIPVHIRVHYVCIPLKPANSRVGHPSHSTTSSQYTIYFLIWLAKLAYNIQFCYAIQRTLKKQNVFKYNKYVKYGIWLMKSVICSRNLKIGKKAPNKLLLQ